MDGPAGDPFDVLNARAAALGMTKTDMNHRIGCQGQDILNNHNKLTLQDAGKLYESVATGGLGGARQDFYDNMIYSKAAFKTIVEEEAAKQGKSGVVDSFLGSVERAVKGGSYSFCVTSCSKAPTLVYRSDSGWFQLPFKDPFTGRVIIKHYVHGKFFDGAKVDCIVGKFNQCTEWDKFKNAWGKVTTALVRNRVAAALQTW